jgi:hypothetical protein
VLAMRSVSVICSVICHELLSTRCKMLDSSGSCRRLVWLSVCATSPIFARANNVADDFIAHRSGDLLPHSAHRPEAAASAASYFLTDGCRRLPLRATDEQTHAQELFIGRFT